LQNPAALVVGGAELRTALDDPAGWPTLPTLYRHFMYLDLVSYLPDDILVKVHRASMAVALEARVPMLDHRVVEFASGLEFGQLVRGGERKWLLRRVLDRYVPRSLIDRPKMGFAVPVGEWLRGPLRPWTESLLDPSRLASEGYLQPEPIGRAWRDHLSHNLSRGAQLWSILMFQAWLEEQKRGG
jgi:asparagine synthase (glutamine-hydrolysing)